MERNSDCRVPGPLNVLLEKLLPQSGSRVVLCRSKTSAPTVPQSISEFMIQIERLWDCGSSFFEVRYLVGRVFCNLARDSIYKEAEPYLHKRLQKA